MSGQSLTPLDVRHRDSGSLPDRHASQYMVSKLSIDVWYALYINDNTRLLVVSSDYIYHTPAYELNSFVDINSGQDHHH